MASTHEHGPPGQPPEADTTQTGGGGGDDGAASIVIPGADVSAPTSATRKDFVTGPEFEFSPASLVGSWFHRLENDVMVWQGVVVAEPQPGVYLLQIDKLDEGASNVQRLMNMDRLLNDDEGYDYRFYDSEVEAKSAYGAWVAAERQRA